MTRASRQRLRSNLSIVVVSSTLITITPSGPLWAATDISRVYREGRAANGSQFEGPRIVARNEKPRGGGTKSKPAVPGDSDQWELDEAFEEAIDEDDRSPTAKEAVGRQVAPELEDDEVRDFLNGSETELFGEDFEEGAKPSPAAK